MSREVRLDPITGEHVMLASVRATPRWAPRHPEAMLAAVDCPFCPGNESATAPSIHQVERRGRWVARAFPNRSPVLMVEEAQQTEVQGMFHGLSGFGAHEVLVESSEHAPLHRQPVDRMATSLELARARMVDLGQDPRLRTLCWFRNHGPEAGASQPHPHAQLVGLPFVPARFERVAERCGAHLAHTGNTLLSAVLHDELEDGRRIIGQHGPVVALCPYAPSQPFEFWLVPEAPGPTLAALTDPEIDGVAHLMHRCLRAIDAAVGAAVSYTAYAIGAAQGDDLRGVGWHLRCVPRLVRPAGMEIGPGTPMHGVFPEDAAAAIRAADG